MKDLATMGTHAAEVFLERRGFGIIECPYKDADSDGPVRPPKGVRLAADARERVGDIAFDARELGHRLPNVVRAHHVGEVAVTHEVRYPFAHLVVEDPVVFLGVLGRVGICRLKEALPADLVVRYGDVGYCQLHARVRTEVVVQRGEHREDVLLVLAPCRLVGDVRELDRLREEPLLDLRDAVLVDDVVADEGADVPRLGARLLLALQPLLVGLLRTVGLGGHAGELP